MEWAPDSSAVEEVLQMLQALRDPTCARHQQALQALTSETANPIFILHLLHIFSRGGAYQGIPPDVRQLAGLVAKNYVFPRMGELSRDVLSAVKMEVMTGLVDPLHNIRSTAALLVGRIASAFVMEYWTDILEAILGGALQFSATEESLNPESPAAISVDGYLLAVKRICEDSAEKLYMNTSLRPLESLIPQLLTAMKSPISSHRLKAIESINSLIYLVPSSDSSSKETPCALIQHMNSFLVSLSELASDDDAKIRRAVCQAIVLLTSFHLSLLAPLLGDVCKFMLQNISDQSEGVAMEACEFWWEFFRNPDACRFVLQNHDEAKSSSVLSLLIPALISRFVLTIEQIEFEREDDEATANGEKEVNFKPVHHTSSKGHDRSSDEDNDDDESGGDEESGGMWTLRRQAARVLDLLACSIPPNVTLSIALPVVQENFRSSNVWIYETGMLTLGALSHGCSDDMAQYLPELLPILLNSVKGQPGQDMPPEVRCISCWVLGRYSEFWFCPDNDEDAACFLPRGAKSIDTQKSIIEALVTVMLDRTPRIQAAACSALTAVFESVASDEENGNDITILDSCLTDMVVQFNRAFEVYGIKNTLILCDTVGTFCDSISPNSLQTMHSTSNTPISKLILNPLCEKLYQLMHTRDPSSNNSQCAPNPHLFPVLECLTSVSTAVGLDLLPFSTAMVRKILQLISDVVDAQDIYIAALSEGADKTSLEEIPDIDFAVCALDVVSGIVEGLRGAFGVVVLGLTVDEHKLQNLPLNHEQLLMYRESGGEEVQQMLVYLLLKCMRFEHSPDLRQSAFSLCGDLISLGESTGVFSTALATSVAASFPLLIPRNETGVDFLNESFLGLCPSEYVQADQSGFQLTPCVLAIFQLAMYQIDVAACLTSPFVANNAVWVIGEYCLAIGTGAVVDQLIPPLACQIAGLLEHIMTLDGASVSSISTLGQDEHYSPLVLKQNLAITLGRLAYINPQAATAEPNTLLTSPGGKCLQSFCKAVFLVQPSESRDHAFLGLISALHVNPQYLLQNPESVEYFVCACESWPTSPFDEQILKGLRNILIACRETPHWNKVIRKLRGAEHLHQIFHLY